MGSRVFVASKETTLKSETIPEMTDRWREREREETWLCLSLLCFWLTSECKRKGERNGGSIYNEKRKKKGIRKKGICRINYSYQMPRGTNEASRMSQHKTTREPISMYV